MIAGMTVKIAVSLPDDLVAHARAEVRAGNAPSVSAYVAEALTHRARLERLELLLDEMLDETGGALTDEERRAADHLIDG